jgi:hypothetical protein
LSREGDEGTFFVAYGNHHPNCYLCNNPSEAYIDYQVGLFDTFVDLESFKNLFNSSNLHYQVKDAEDAMIEIGACLEHLDQLKSLEKAIIKNKNILSEDIIKKNMQ